MKTCRTCKTRFEGGRPFQPWCSPECGTVQALEKLAKAKAKRAACDRRETKARLTVLVETLPKLKKQAQDAFNAFIRARDDKLPCVCCGEWPKAGERFTGGVWDAGHYRGRGACPELAFDERNCHKQRKYCNSRAWDVAGYRAELIRRIGLDEVTELEGPHPPKHYTRDDMRAIRDLYRAKLKQLKIVCGSA